MPSRNVKKARPAKMSQYPESAMNDAIKAVKEEGQSVRAAALEYGVPRTTLQDRVTDVHGPQHGRPTHLHPDEEELLVEHIKLLADWGFPMTQVDVTVFVKSYLEKAGITSKFKNNLPTVRYVDSLLQRYKDLRLRKTSLIKKSKAAVSREEVTEFIKHLAATAEGVPPENIYNYDETNFTDNPGSKKCLFRKGTKYCEKVMNHSKSSISCMFCGSATGELVPPMVVYKAANIYSSWCERGPKGAVYSCTKSGWFDQFQFEKWFEEILLPRLKRKVGKKLVLGDNLASHISPGVISSCKANNIEFVCLPPNSTDKLQPLDVAVFGPLKSAWRALLTSYKAQNPSFPSVRKTDFPRLLARVQ
jgi:hypothetical protein